MISSKLTSCVTVIYGPDQSNQHVSNPTYKQESSYELIDTIHLFRVSLFLN